MREIGFIIEVVFRDGSNLSARGTMRRETIGSIPSFWRSLDGPLMAPEHLRDKQLHSINFRLIDDPPKSEPA